jgi:hypothetical protein
LAVASQLYCHHIPWYIDQPNNLRLQRWGPSYNFVYRPSAFHINLTKLYVNFAKKMKIHQLWFPLISIKSQAWNIWIIFPFSWEFHHPNWRSQIFQRGWAQPPTRIHLARHPNYNARIPGLIQWSLRSQCCQLFANHNL